MEHETEHTGQLARAATRKPRVPARTKFPIPRPCAPPTFPSPSWSIDRKRSGRDKYDCNRYSVPYQEIYHRLLPIHQSERYLCEWGKAVTGVTGMRNHAHAGSGLAQLGYEVNADSRQQQQIMRRYRTRRVRPGPTGSARQMPIRGDPPTNGFASHCVSRLC